MTTLLNSILWGSTRLVAIWLVFIFSSGLAHANNYPSGLHELKSDKLVVRLVSGVISDQALLWQRSYQVFVQADGDTDWYQAAILLPVKSGSVNSEFSIRTRVNGDTVVRDYKLLSRGRDVWLIEAQKSLGPGQSLEDDTEIMIRRFKLTNPDSDSNPSWKYLFRLESETRRSGQKGMTIERVLTQEASFKR